MRQHSAVGFQGSVKSLPREVQARACVRVCVEKCGGVLDKIHRAQKRLQRRGKEQTQS